MKQDQIEPGEMPEKECKASLVLSHMLISSSLPRREGRSELFSQGIRIGRSLRSFPPSKPSRHLSMHSAFQYSDKTLLRVLQCELMDSVKPPERTSQSTAQPVV